MRETLDKIKKVRRIAVQLKRKLNLPACVEIDDLVQAGCEGMLTAEARYRPEQSGGATMDTYSFPRIRGAMLDELLKYTWAPRSVRVAQRDGPVSSKQEMDILNIYPISIGAYPKVAKDVPSESPTPYEEWERDKKRDRIRAVVGSLPPAERIAIELTYFNGFKLFEAAECMGVVDSRVCQLRKNAEKKLKEML